MAKVDPSFVVYIDESGDEGFHVRSSQWFILTAVVTRKARDLATVKLIDTVRTRLKKDPKKALHFRDIRHVHRLPYIGEISQAQLRAMSVLVHKPSLSEPETFREKYRLHHYCVRYLLERVSWFCRDHHRPTTYGGDGSAQIVFSNRAGMSYDEIRDYLNNLLISARLTMGGVNVFDVRLDGNVIKTSQITANVHSQRMGLQIADAVASSIFAAVEPSQHGYTEDRYVRMLKPILYHHRGCYRGYGLKFFPDVASLINSDPNLKWVNEVYPK